MLHRPFFRHLRIDMTKTASPTLAETLKEISKNNEKRIPADKRAIMAQANDDLRNSGIMDDIVTVGCTIPPFSLKNQEDEAISSQELLENGPLVLSFFRGVWCGYCNAELSALAEAEEAMKAKGATLVILSPQTQEHAIKSREVNGLKADILSDLGNDVAAKLGIKFRLDPKVEEVYRSLGLDLSKFNGDDSWTLPVPTRLIIGTDGTVIYSATDPDYTKRPEPAETIAALPV